MGTVRGHVQKGDIIHFSHEEGDWIYGVSIEKKIEGWMHKKYLKEI